MLFINSLSFNSNPYPLPSFYNVLYSPRPESPYKQAPSCKQAPLHANELPQTSFLLPTNHPPPSTHLFLIKKLPNSQ